MEPIRLDIEGLHSFREPQTIDLAALADSGLFGIFGPTGSGKSTILDAMTIALYGKAERNGRLGHTVNQVGGRRRRPVSTLSGGETFTTSLAMALALSGQIQLHGHYPLQFFFLDEGFGTLDPERLDTVVSSLERLPKGDMLVGVITHVPEMRQRIERRLMVEAATPLHGTRVRADRG